MTVVVENRRAYLRCNVCQRSLRNLVHSVNARIARPRSFGFIVVNGAR